MGTGTDRHALILAAVVTGVTGTWMCLTTDGARSVEAPPQAQTEQRLQSSKPVGDATRGEALYGASCVVCHGPQAGGKIGPRLSGNPVLANEPAFRKIVHEGRHVMPPLKDTLSDQQIGDILAWLRTLP